MMKTVCVIGNRVVHHNVDGELFEMTEGEAFDVSAKDYKRLIALGVVADVVPVKAETAKTSKAGKSEKKD